MNRYIYVFFLLAISLGTPGCFQRLPDAEIAGRSSEDDRNSERVPLRENVVEDDVAEATEAFENDSVDDRNSRRVPLRDGTPLRELIGGATVRILDADHNAIGLGVALEHFGEDKFQVLTASHLLPADGELYVERRLASDRGGMSGTLYSLGPVIVIANDPDRDLALLEILSSLRPARQAVLADAADDYYTADDDAAAAKPDTRSLAHAVAWGGEDDQPRVVDVTIAGQKRAARADKPGPVEYWLVEQASEQGMSGGGLFSPRGQLLGIASGNSGGAAYFVHRCEVAEFLER